MSEFLSKHDEMVISDMVESYSKRQIEKVCPLKSLCEVNFVCQNISYLSARSSGEITDMEIRIDPDCSQQECPVIEDDDSLKLIEERLAVIVRETMGIKKN